MRSTAVGRIAKRKLNMPHIEYKSCSLSTVVFNCRLNELVSFTKSRPRGCLFLMKPAWTAYNTCWLWHTLAISNVVQQAKLPSKTWSKQTEYPASIGRCFLQAEQNIAKRSNSHPISKEFNLLCDIGNFLPKINEWILFARSIQGELASVVTVTYSDS